MSGSVVFVSAMPQAAPGAVQAVVLGKDGQSATTGIHDGGFDPVVLDAANGDAITVTLTYGSGATTSEELAVRSGRAPRVVRTSPAPHRTGVPLNAVIRVVFSSPVDLESARAGIQLTTGSGSVVPGEVEVAGIAAVEYVTAGNLAPETTYRLDVTTDVRDVLGRALAEPVSVEFRTGNREEVPPAGPSSGPLELSIAPSSIGLLQGETGHAQVTIRRGETFTGAVLLHANSPAGVKVTFSYRYMDAGITTATVNLTADSTVAPGTKTVGIRAVDRSGTLTAPTTLTVDVAGASIVLDSTTLTSAVGAPAVTSILTITRYSPFAGPVDLTVTGAPAEVTATISPGSAAGATSILSVSAAAGAVNGTYPLQIHAKGTGITDAFATVYLTITGGTAVPAPLTFDPATITVMAGGPSATSVLTRNTAAVPGTRYVLRVSPPPPGLTASLPSFIMSSTTTTLTVQAEAAVAPGTYFVTVSGAVWVMEESRPRFPSSFAELQVVVSAAPASLR